MNKKKNVVKIIQYPSMPDAESFITTHHQKKPEKTVLQLIGTCTVEYQGRAKSYLDSGDRIIIIKQDGNILVHQPVMREPINWQPSGSIIEYKIKDDSLILKSRHRKPAEKMVIIFTELFTIIVSQLIDSAQLKITGMESDVVKHIINNPSCIEEGLRIQNQEKQVRSGMIDVFAYDKDHTPVIIEVKRSLATISNVHQLRMYVQDMQQDSEKTLVRGILCAPRIPDMIKNLLQDYNLEWKEVEHELVLPDDQQKSLNEF